METNKILTASLLDLLFDGRNKGYGAYELRKTYQNRIIKSLSVATSVAGIVFALLAFANSTRHERRDLFNSREVIMEDLQEKQQEKIPELERPPEPPQVRTEIVTPPVVVDDNEVEHSMPTQDDIDSAKIGLIKTNGIADNGLTDITKIEDNRGIIEDRTEVNAEPFTTVQVEARYAGNWENFLRRNLRAEVPVDNGAPSGKYKIIIQFIVDVDGTISDIIPITNLGYGMEQEAIRVIKKSDKWEPAFQNGIHVKAYRRQPITFEVLSDE